MNTTESYKFWKASVIDDRKLKDRVEDHVVVISALLILLCDLGVISCELLQRTDENNNWFLYKKRIIGVSGDPQSRHNI